MRYKFRAYWKPGKIMMPSEKIESINFETKVLGIYYPIWSIEFHKLRMSDFELMQWTGLTDCDGKEVYEGDIVATGIETTYQVEWSQSHAQYFLKVLKTKSVLTKELRFPLWQYTVDSVCAFEVIGNIYENGSLLDG